MHHTKRRVVPGGCQHQAARWQKPTVKADSSESPLVSQFTVVLTKQLSSSPLLRRRYPLQGVGRASRSLRAQLCAKSSFGQHTQQLSCRLETLKEVQTLRDNCLDMSPQSSHTKEVNTVYLKLFPVATTHFWLGSRQR